MSRVALLIIDMQNGFLDEYRDPSAIPDTCDLINYVARLFRNAKQPVFHIRDVEDSEDMSEQALAISALIEQTDIDQHLDKEYSNAFHQTDLAQRLQALNVELVVVCGQAAEHCVVFTYNGAVEQGFTPVVLQGGVLSAQPGRAETLQLDRNGISHAALRVLLPSLS